jgi:hypothetical protein
MRQFLWETWELFYWSFCCPSKLQRRMNEWSPVEEKDGQQPDTKASRILFARANGRRFIGQYFLVSVLLSLPIVGLIVSSGQAVGWLLLIAAPLIGCALGYCFLPVSISFCSPLLLALIYWQPTNFYVKLFQSALDLLPPLSQIAVIGIGVGILLSSITNGLGFWIIKKHSLALGYKTIWVGSMLSVLLGSGLASQNLFFALSMTFITGCFLVPIRDSVDSDITNVVSFATISSVFSILLGMAFGVEIGVAFFMTFYFLFCIMTVAIKVSVKFGEASGVTGAVLGTVAGAVGSALWLAVTVVVMFSLVGGVAGSVVGIVAGVARLPLTSFLLVCFIFAVSLASIQRKWLGIFASAILAAMGFARLDINALWAIPVTMLGYYRLSPDYFLALLPSLIYSRSIVKKLSFNPVQWLSRLPPHSTEFLWVPLPNHARLLADAFRKDAAMALTTLQKMQASALPGFQSTVHRAIPLVVADQLSDVDTTSALVNSSTSSHPIIPLLIPGFYQPSSETKTAPPPTHWVHPDIATLFPRFQQIATDTAASLQAGSAALRERGLERLVTQLELLQAQLPGLGLKPESIRRWQPAITRWKNILQLEITEQQKLAQGELLNPFQFGNPLRPNRFHAFKGRQTFADQLVRQILDRNRPTLVLHGSRRSGKTSFLLNLPRLLPSDLIPIYIDMQQGSLTSSDGDFCYGLARAIYRDGSSQGLKTSLPQRTDFYRNPFATLEDWLDATLPQLGTRRLLLNLDEFEKIGSAMREGRVSDRLFDALRSLIQHYDPLGFLFSGVQTLEELGPQWSSYFISVVPLEMGYLTPTEAEDLLRNPDPDFALRYAPGIVETLLHLTRCQPYLLQLLGSALVTEANLIHTTLADEALLQSAIPAAFTSGEPYFTNVWTEFTGTNEAEVAAGQTLLLALAHHQPHTLQDPPTQAARQRLLRYHVIEQTEDGDRIEIPLFQQWVQERAIHP